MEPAALPLHWTINSQLELFEVVAEGDVDLAEANRMLDALVGSNALGYRKLFDGSLGDTQLSALDILSIGVRIRALHAGSTLGPLAVVVPVSSPPAGGRCACSARRIKPAIGSNRRRSAAACP